MTKHEILYSQVDSTTRLIFELSFGKKVKRSSRSNAITLNDTCWVLRGFMNELVVIKILQNKEQFWRLQPTLLSFSAQLVNIKPCKQWTRWSKAIYLATLVWFGTWKLQPVTTAYHLNKKMTNMKQSRITNHCTFV